MERLGPGLLMLLLALVLVGLVWAGWRGRLKRQAGVAAPVPAPADLGAERFRCSGQYVVTTTAGDWLDRIAVHGLGVRTRAEAVVTDDGIAFDRAGAERLFVPREDLDGVRLESGMAGKFVEKDGLVVVGWDLGGTAVDTGFRPRYAQEKKALVAAIEELMGSAAPAGGGSGKE
ncbi:hypothetical protein GCM10012320_00710 [Sinomonas cellulolyticus]|jgi:hypothetical protein|uniref:PH domain-containing protein n=1 Tax=Sinomonas cellulolyticus TaxID=2801916 RepID=A0ABS1K0X7_9MICC|nr:MULTISPECIES: hypothetical protein [Sinomonas]MBL0705190.1 hypothetical protein [Sinomonas cellulolyticus]GHG39785.1 hypothetical protein GCM10012320_00710 [Sinomonas sp. KCTC 49339]